MKRKIIPNGPWVKTFAYLPVRTITKKWAWLRPIRKRNVIIDGPFIDEPDVQFATTLELMIETLKGEID